MCIYMDNVVINFLQGSAVGVETILVGLIIETLVANFL